MINDQCKWSGQEIEQDALSQDQLTECDYVECPECGSIRRVTKKVQIGIGLGRYYHLYPVHNTLMGTARVRDQWWKLNKDSQQWAIVQRSEVE